VSLLQKVEYSGLFIALILGGVDFWTSVIVTRCRPYGASGIVDIVLQRCRLYGADNREDTAGMPIPESPSGVILVKD